jgi:hypothetical protein
MLNGCDRMGLGLRGYLFSNGTTFEDLCMTKMLMMAGVFLMGAASALAQAAGGAPAGANGICGDGSYSMAASKSGACRGHKGVQTWYVAAAAAPGATSAAKVVAMPAPVSATVPDSAMPAPTPAAAPAAISIAKKQGPAAAAAARTAAPGGGPGLVWVNTSSNVYHCYGDTYYGKTKAGQYMTEDAAKARLAHGVGGKGCAAK